MVRISRKESSPSHFNHLTSAEVPSWLTQITEITACTNKQLSKLTIREKPDELYFAILEYGFLCQLHQDHPLAPRDSTRDAALTVREDDPFEPLGLDPMEQPKNDDGDIFSMAHRIGSSGDAGVNDTGHASTMPKFKLGFGMSTIVWPPPPSLHGTHLSQLRNDFEDNYYTARLNDTEAPIPKKGDSSNPFGIDLHTVSSEIDANLDNTIYLLHYSMGDPIPDGNGNSILYSEVQLVTASAIGSKFLREFAVGVLEWKKQKDHRDTNGKAFTLYRFMTGPMGCNYGWWQNEGLRHARPQTSVILKDDSVEQLIDDVHKFLLPSTRRWYISHGLPHRRSYLFYGPPGTGKTSTIRVLASKFNLNCCFLSMTNSNFSNQLLGIAFSKMPRNALLVLEDVDALFNENRTSMGNDNLTFSGLLNALDGLVSTDRSITVMTTNFIERLDQALIRGGRVDKKIYFPRPGKNELEKLFNYFYPNSDKKMGEKFANDVIGYGGEKGTSIATLQQLFVGHRDDGAEVVIESIEKFYEEIFEHEEKKEA